MLLFRSCFLFSAASFLETRSSVRIGAPFRPRGLSSVQTQANMATSDVASIVVYVTVPNSDAGRDLASGIVNNKLAACVNQVPAIQSTYWWEGKVETDSEVLLIIKTKKSLLHELTEHVKQHHPSDVPEVIALPIVGGNPAYLKWIEQSTK